MCRDDERLRILGSDYHTDSGSDDYYCIEEAETDVYNSDPVGYTSEESNEEFQECRSQKREALQLQLQLQLDGDVYPSDYRSSDDEGLPLYDSDDEDYRAMITQRGIRYDDQCPINMIKFEMGMQFDSREEFTTAVKNHAIGNGFNAKFVRSNKLNVEVKCKGKDCPWRIYASWGSMKDYFIVKALHDEHTCSRVSRNKHADYKWIANHFLDRFRINLDWKAIDMMREIHEEFRITVSKQTCYKAKAAARKIIHGSLKQHYHLLPSYVAALKEAAKGTFVLILHGDPPHSVVRFKRLYICFASLAIRFRKGCRRVINLDACFLKTSLKGQLLCAVGKDGNKHIFPIAWAVVEEENQESWSWFLELLMKDLKINDGKHWTIISDQQKVLNCLVNQF